MNASIQKPVDRRSVFLSGRLAYRRFVDCLSCCAERRSSYVLLERRQLAVSSVLLSTVSILPVLPRQEFHLRRGGLQVTAFGFPNAVTRGIRKSERLVEPAWRKAKQINQLKSLIGRHASC